MSRKNVIKPQLINTDDPLAAWRQGVALLLDLGEVYGLTTHIGRPSAYDLDLVRAINPRLYDSKCQSTTDVINTIFPIRLWKGGDRQRLYAHYLERHERARRMRKATRAKWGTYFERMVRFGRDGRNQLEECITAARSWTNNHHAALVMHMSSCETDSIRRVIGNPCLQYIEFTCPDKASMSLVAVYRNHDYFGKTLGNFVGLAALLNFVARATGREPCTLTCFSAHAYFESSKSNLRSLAEL